MRKTKDLATRTPQRHRRELSYFEGIKSSCSTKGPNQVALVKHPVINENRGKGIDMFYINTYTYMYIVSALLQFSARFVFYRKGFK